MRRGPPLTRAQSRMVDRIAIDELGIPGVVLMENAAMALEREALAMLGGRPADLPVVVLAGPGNNGGDGFALARRLVVAGRAAEGVAAAAGETLVLVSVSRVLRKCVATVACRPRTV